MPVTDLVILLHLTTATLIHSVRLWHPKQRSQSRLKRALPALSDPTRRRLKRCYQGCMRSHEEWTTPLWSPSNTIPVSLPFLRKLTNLTLRTTRGSRPTTTTNSKGVGSHQASPKQAFMKVWSMPWLSRQLRSRITRSCSLDDTPQSHRLSHSAAELLTTLTILKALTHSQSLIRNAWDSWAARLNRSGRTKSAN